MKLNNSKILRWTIGIGALTTVVCAGYLTATLYATGAEAQPDKKAIERQHSQQPHQYLDGQW